MRTLRLALPFSAILLCLVSCGPSSPAMPAGCTRYVTPSADDTMTVNAAIVGIADGETFCFGAGTYRFTDPVDFRDLEGLTVRGTGATRADVVLDFAMETGGAKGLTFTSVNDLLVENLTILDAPGDNLFATGSTGLTFRNVSSGWVARTPSGRYALYPVQSTDVLLDDVEAFGSSDAGIYVGQTTNCLVRNSEAHGNVAGIEIENSTNCEVVGNHAHDNSGGILVFELPGLEQHGSGTLVHDNMVVDNNTANFGEPGTTVAAIPAGTGIMLLAANDVEVTGNTVTGNDATGLFVVSYETVTLVGGEPSMDPLYEPFSESIWVHGNTWSDNGGAPPESIMDVLLLLSVTTLEDIIWDGFLAPGDTADTLCIGETGATFRDIDVAGGFAGSTTDPAPHACTGTTRPPVTL